jgi:hypothetical protein
MVSEDQPGHSRAGDAGFGRGRGNRPLAERARFFFTLSSVFDHSLPGAGCTALGIGAPSGAESGQQASHAPHSHGMLGP